MLLISSLLVLPLFHSLTFHFSPSLSLTSLSLSLVMSFILQLSPLSPLFHILNLFTNISHSTYLSNYLSLYIPIYLFLYIPTYFSLYKPTYLSLSLKLCHSFALHPSLPKCVPIWSIFIFIFTLLSIISQVYMHCSLSILLFLLSFSIAHTYRLARIQIISSLSVHCRTSTFSDCAKPIVQNISLDSREFYLK